MTRRLPVPRRIAWGAGAATLIGGVALLLSPVPARFLIVADPYRPSDAVVVMAGDPGYERTAAAAALTRKSPRETLILTGGEPGPGDSAESLRTMAIALGVSSARIRVETTSHSTREAVVAVAPILQSLQARTVTIVTSPYHQRRATAAARRAWPGVTVLSHPASPSAWTPSRWWRTASSRRAVVTEYAKLLYYELRGWL